MAIDGDVHLGHCIRRTRHWSLTNSIRPASRRLPPGRRFVACHRLPSKPSAPNDQPIEVRGGTNDLPRLWSPLVGPLVKEVRHRTSEHATPNTCLASFSIPEGRLLPVFGPRMGGDLWQSDDPKDRERITDLLINNDATIQSLEPLVEVLLGSRAHEDFSDRYSWVKEDFERAFYQNAPELGSACMSLISSR